MLTNMTCQLIRIIRYIFIKRINKEKHIILLSIVHNTEIAQN